MRVRIIFPLVVAGFSSLVGSAQAQSAYSYPWCAVEANKTGATSCAFVTLQQCRASLGGIGGTCIRNPFVRGGLN